MNEWIWLAILFVFVAGLSFVVLSWSNLRRQRQEQPDDDEIALDSSSTLEPLTDSSSGSRLGKDSKSTLVLGDATPALSQQIPASEADLAKLQPELRAAGFYGPNALTQYLAIRATLIIVPLVVAGGLAVILDKAIIPEIMVAGFVLAGLGFALPRAYINYLGKERRRQIEGGLPVAVDLLTLGISAGQNILFALQRVAREIRSSYPVVALELELVHRQASLNTLAHALDQLAERVQVAEIRNLVMILTQSERLGTDIATALLEFATNFRLTLRQRADAKASRASFWMLFPTLICFWLPAAAVLMGPIFFEFRERQRERTRALEAQRDPEVLRNLGETAAPVFDKSRR